MKNTWVIAAVWGMGCIDNSIPMAEFDSGGAAASASDPPNERSLAAESQPRSTPGQRGPGPSGNGTEGDTADGGWCGVSDLQMVAEVRHEDGEPALFGYPTQSHRLWFRVTNPCESAVEIETRGGCLVEGWRAEAGAISASASFPCGGESGIRRIEPGAVMEQEVTPFHDLVEGVYEFTVELGVGDPETGEWVRIGTDYTVLSRAAW